MYYWDVVIPLQPPWANYTETWIRLWLPSKTNRLEWILCVCFVYKYYRFYCNEGEPSVWDLEPEIVNDDKYFSLVLFKQRLTPIYTIKVRLIFFNVTVKIIMSGTFHNSLLLPKNHTNNLKPVQIYHIMMRNSYYFFPLPFVFLTRFLRHLGNIGH